MLNDFDRHGQGDVGPDVMVYLPCAVSVWVGEV